MLRRARRGRLLAALRDDHHVAPAQASIDLFLIIPEQRHKGIGHDLLEQALRRAEALGCKRVEMLLPEPRDERHAFFEGYGFVNNGYDLYVKAKSG